MSVIKTTMFSMFCTHTTVEIEPKYQHYHLTQKPCFSFKPRILCGVWKYTETSVTGMLNQKPYAALSLERPYSKYLNNVQNQER